MSAFHPLRSVPIVQHDRQMAEPLRAQIWAERMRSGVWLLALLAVVATVLFVEDRLWNPQGQLIEARVIQSGIRAGKYRNTPIVTVRLADGSVREVQARWASSLRGCQSGDRIALVQRGSALTIGVKGCNLTT
jgi:hypothetical protein